MKTDVILYGLADAMVAGQLQSRVMAVKGVTNCLVNQNVSRMTIEIPDELVEQVQPEIMGILAQMCPNITPVM